GPAVSPPTLNKLSPYVTAGEVDSPKKFIRVAKDVSRLTPVLFSDSRMRDGLDPLPTRQTYVDCGDVTFQAIKTVLRDRQKVALSPNDGNRLFQIFEDGQHISTGLNVLLGSRSSGKTYTLEQIAKTDYKVKFIRQFSLVQQDEEAYEKEFERDVQRQKGNFIDSYLSGFKRIVDEVLKVDLEADNRDVEKFVSTLLASADEIDKQDAFSKTGLFGEVEFSTSDNQTLKELIESVRQVIENIEFRATIEKHIDRNSLQRLIIDLISQYWTRTLDNKKRQFVNRLVKDIKDNLKLRTAATQIEDVDLYDVAMNRQKVRRFSEIVNFLKTEAVISKEPIQGFMIEARQGRYRGAGDIKNASKVRAAFSDAFASYESPYEYLLKLKNIDALNKADLHKLFAQFRYRILNRDGLEVSGGERSEFRLLQEIKDAQNFEMLLVDEPESSFDNLFLKSDVNQIIREISQSMPVVLVTHNSTVGASVGADYLIYAAKESTSSGVEFQLYSGYPTDQQLRSLSGVTVPNHTVVMDSLEAGVEAYNQRKQGYDSIKD
ncbi:MAG: hypothetical protein KDA66_18075, partial [Planctomycetaceae bacterium]|nr:hypothetical protein [Planctomycetaceae bacterium]